MKYGKLPAKEAEKIPQNTLCVDIIDPYIIRRKGRKENLHINAVTMIEPVTRWFEITQYDEKIVLSIVNLFETT